MRYNSILPFSAFVLFVSIFTNTNPMLSGFFGGARRSTKPERSVPAFPAGVETYEEIVQYRPWLSDKRLEKEVEKRMPGLASRLFDGTVKTAHTLCEGFGITGAVSTKAGEVATAIGRGAEATPETTRKAADCAKVGTAVIGGGATLLLAAGTGIAAARGDEPRNDITRTLLRTRPTVDKASLSPEARGGAARIEQFSPAVFGASAPDDEQLDHIQELDLAGNALRTIPDLSKLAGLTTLILTGNILGQSPAALGIAPLSLLATLSLAQNGLDSAHLPDLSVLQALQDLDLSGNPLDTLTPLPRTITHLNLAGTRITIVRTITENLEGAPLHHINVTTTPLVESADGLVDTHSTLTRTFPEVEVIPMPSGALTAGVLAKRSAGTAFRAVRSGLGSLWGATTSLFSGKAIAMPMAPAPVYAGKPSAEPDRETTPEQLAVSAEFIRTLLVASETENANTLDLSSKGIRHIPESVIKQFSISGHYADVHTIDLSNNPLEAVPATMTSAFSYLRSLNLRKTRVNIDSLVAALQGARRDLQEVFIGETHTIDQATGQARLDREINPARERRRWPRITLKA